MTDTLEPTFDTGAALERAESARLSSMRCQWSELPLTIRRGVRQAFETRMENGKPLPSVHIADQLKEQGYPIEHQQVVHHRKRQCTYCTLTGTE